LIGSVVRILITTYHQNNVAPITIKTTTLL